MWWSCCCALKGLGGRIPPSKWQHRRGGCGLSRLSTDRYFTRKYSRSPPYSYAAAKAAHLAPSSGHMGTETKKEVKKNTPCTLWYDGCPPISGDACDKARHSVMYNLHTHTHTSGFRTSVRSREPQRVPTTPTTRTLWRRTVCFPSKFVQK